MSVTVEFGGWPRPPRWVWAIAGVATVAVLAGVVAARTGPHRAGPASAVTSPASPSNGDLRMPRKPARMAGRPLPRGAGLRLVLGAQQPAWLWVTTGQAEPIRGLPRRDNGYQLIRIAGGWAALPFPGNGVSCGNCAPRPMPAYYIADGSREASRRLSAADFAAPADCRCRVAGQLPCRCRYAGHRGHGARVYCFRRGAWAVPQACRAGTSSIRAPSLACCWCRNSRERALSGTSSGSPAPAGSAVLSRT